MKIDFNQIDRESFYVNEHIINGELFYLVTPKQIGVKWSQENKIFRSSVWDSNGELISASWPKFVNWGETPDIFPTPNNIKKCRFMQKVDGSTLIISKRNGKFMFRTRGTVDASKMEKNGHEIAELIATHPEILKYQPHFDTWPFSLLFEWVSPLNRIVILYPEPELYFLGIVNHDNYSLWNQDWLDSIAKMWGVKRPPIYSFENVNTIEDLIKTIEPWKGVEGIVVYSSNDQVMHKIKALDYLCRHRLKSELSSFEKLIDFWFAVGKPTTFNLFWNEVEKLTDYETAQEHFGDISRIIDGWKEVQKIEAGFKRFIEVELVKYPTRKLQAVVVFQSYGKNNSRASMVFTLLDGKSLTDKEYKKLLFQVLK